MASDSGVHVEVGKRLAVAPLTGPKEETGDTDMVNVSKKPTVEYEGYQRTITDVIRIRQEGEGSEGEEVSLLMVGINDAIKTCRSLRQRLERLKQRRNTSFHQQRTEPVTP